MPYCGSFQTYRGTPLAWIPFWGDCVFIAVSIGAVAALWIDALLR